MTPGAVSMGQAGEGRYPDLAAPAQLLLRMQAGHGWEEQDVEEQ